MMMKVIALLYHDVVELGQSVASGFNWPGAQRYKLNRQLFAEHLHLLDGQGRRAISIVALPQSAPMPSPQFVMTFDDGGSSSMLIGELLASRGWVGHFFVPSDYIARPGFLNVSEIRELHDAGHVIGSHSASHPWRISHCEPNELSYEWWKSVEILSDIIGDRVRAASVPGGFYSRKVAQAAAAAGIQFLFTSEPRIQSFLAESCRVLGRYSIVRGTSLNELAAVVAGNSSVWLKQMLRWNLAKLLKGLAGPAYFNIRKYFLTENR